MSPPHLPDFDSIEEEFEYWMELFNIFYEQLEYTENEYEEVISQVREWETDLDATIEENQKKIDELTTENANIEQYNEMLKTKLNYSKTEMYKIEKELETVTEKFATLKELHNAIKQSEENKPEMGDGDLEVPNQVTVGESVDQLGDNSKYLEANEFLSQSLDKMKRKLECLQLELSIIQEGIPK